MDSFISCWPSPSSWSWSKSLGDEDDLNHSGLCRTRRNVYREELQMNAVKIPAMALIVRCALMLFSIKKK
jgi:hypothetical protein